MYLTHPISNLCLVLSGISMSVISAGEANDNHMISSGDLKRHHERGLNGVKPEFSKADAESTTSSSTTLPKNLFKSNRIIGGEEENTNRIPLSTPYWQADEDRYSYSVSLQAKNSATLNGHFCGGSLIARDVVLTAAHCVDSLDTAEVNVVIGRHGLDDDDGDVIPVDLEKSVLHPFWKQWYTIDNEYDFALLYLTRPTTANVKFVKLNDDANFPEYGSSANAIGWGDTNVFLDEITLPDALHEVELSVISNDECRSSGIVIDGILYSYLFSISDSMLCTFSEDKDACQGDSGGPLVIRGNDSMGADDVQIGITSWGLFCATNIFPGVYSRVSSAYSWIKSAVCIYSEDPPSHLSCESESTADSAPISASNLMPTRSPLFIAETFSPTYRPTSQPTATAKESHEPSSNPSLITSLKPSITPTSAPSYSFLPTSTPSLQASYSPSESPSRAIVPSSQPTSSPTGTSQPSSSPLPTSAPPIESSSPSVSPSAYGRKSFIPTSSPLPLSSRPSSNPATNGPNSALASNTNTEDTSPSAAEADTLLIPVSTVAEPEDKMYEGEVEMDVDSASTSSSFSGRSRLSSVTIAGGLCVTWWFVQQMAWGV